MRKRAYLAGICCVLALLALTVAESSASQRNQQEQSSASAEATSISQANPELLAFAPAEDDGDKPRRRPKRVKEDDPPPAKRSQPPKSADSNAPAASGNDQKPIAPVAQPPALVGPTTVATPQESLTWFSIRLFDRIGHRLGGGDEAAQAPAAQAGSQQGASDAKPEPKKSGPVVRKSIREDAKNASSKKAQAKAAPVDPEAAKLKIDIKNFKGFSKNKK